MSPTEIMGDPTQEIPCPKCKAAVFVTTPTARVVNFPDISFVMLSHPNIDLCPACKAPLACGIAKVNGEAIELRWVVLQVQARSPIAAPSPQELAAVQNSKLGR